MAQQSTFIEEMMAAGRGVIGLLTGDRQAGSYFDLGERGLAVHNVHVLPRHHANARRVKHDVVRIVSQYRLQVMIIPRLHPFASKCLRVIGIDHGNGPVMKKDYPCSWHRARG